MLPSDTFRILVNKKLEVESISLYALCNTAKVPYSSFYSFLNYDRKRIDLDHVFSICEVLTIPINEIFEESTKNTVDSLCSADEL